MNDYDSTTNPKLHISVHLWSMKNIGAVTTGPVKQTFSAKTIFLFVNLNIYFGCSNNGLTKMVLLSTHNMCFD